MRLLATLILSAMALASRSGPELALVFITLAAAFGCSRTGLRTAWSGFRPFFFLLIFTALLQIFLTPGKSLPLFSRFGLPGTFEGLQLAVFVMSRLAAVILLSTHLITTTSPLELSRSLGWALLPAGRFGFPVADAVLLVNLGFQFFPLLFEESINLRLALEARGISLRHPRAALRLKALTALILSLLTAVLERSHRLAAALEMKNPARPGKPRLRFPSWNIESSLALAVLPIPVLSWALIRALSP